ncbi:hypothetical protein [Vibrio sp. SCSIO 43136]|uniref:hypothetical protein n=1 Tax=Vibrio sp. SCSIO 43136 TaxID=2819101 RepID=UPI002075F080|nr:hypothetical protein [Vibrio sp. SCSIO 43136]USD64371.1 hypothetical protein J4N39_09665 [Vibrio sp. SCSIO 43136]
MNDDKSYQMAIDLLCCHLGLSEDEAKKQLGLEAAGMPSDRIVETQAALMGLNQEK